jgi:cytochrome c oxidase cbb3-type subunit 2
MNRLWVILFGAVGVLLLTSLSLVVDPYIEFASIPPESKLQPYTIEQGKGREMYVSLGCMYCHSQQPRDPNFAPDGLRGWGRPSTPGDYAYDYPHQLGTMRTGPDLFNIGARQRSQAWQLSHLYNPRSVVAESIMPGYPFLFDVKPATEPGDVTVKVAAPFAPTSGVVVAKPEALALVSYLLGLDHTYPSDALALQSTGSGGKP